MLHKDGKRAGALWWSDHVSNLTPIKSMYIGSTLVWDAGGDESLVQITLGTGNEARDALRAALADRGLDYRTVTELPFDIELVGTGSAQHMFNGCSALTHVPVLGTSSVTNMHYMFNGCSSLTHVPDMDTAQVTSMNFMFRNCSSLVSVPDLDTSLVTNMYSMFENCQALTSVPDMGTAQVTSMYRMFYGCSLLTHVPDMDTAQVTSMNFMFRDCSSLTDGNVRLIGRNPNVNTTGMISGSGLTREPFYDTNGNPI